MCINLAGNMRPNLLIQGHVMTSKSTPVCQTLQTSSKSRLLIITFLCPEIHAFFQND